jgi:hypothetical protein
MGGRGTFAAGNKVAYTYEVDSQNYPDGKFEGVKVIVGAPGTNLHKLPESSHSSGAYLKMEPDGSFNMMRIYDKQHVLRLEIAYHAEKQLGQGKVLHYHYYDEIFSKNAEGDFGRSTAIRITKKSRIYQRYKKFFKGVVL